MDQVNCGPIEAHHNWENTDHVKIAPAELPGSDNQLASSNPFLGLRACEELQVGSFQSTTSYRKLVCITAEIDILVLQIIPYAFPPISRTSFSDDCAVYCVQCSVAINHNLQTPFLLRSLNSCPYFHICIAAFCC